MVLVEIVLKWAAHDAAFDMFLPQHGDENRAGFVLQRSDELFLRAVALREVRVRKFLARDGAFIDKRTTQLGDRVKHIALAGIAR